MKTCTQSKSTVLGSINISHKKKKKRKKRKNSVRKEGKEGKRTGGGKKEVGRKNGEEREIFVECSVDLSSARGLTYKPFLWFLKERKRKKKIRSF